MPMYNLLEHSKNDSKTTESLWNYYKDKPNSGANNNINYSIKDSKSLITTQNSNFNYLIDPTFTKVDRFLVLSFENEDDRTSFSKY